MHLFLLQHGDALAESVNPQRPLSEQGRNDIARLFRRLDGFRHIFAWFEKLDLILIAFINFALIADGLVW